VTFHELAPRLTRIEVSLDVEPEGLLEKAGRGMRFAKRAVRGDLHRFKAYAEVAEEAEEGGWRGTIQDGDVKKKTERRSSGSGSSKRSRSRNRHSTNGSDPSSGSSRRAGGPLRHSTMSQAWVRCARAWGAEPPARGQPC